MNNKTLNWYQVRERKNEFFKKFLDNIEINWNTFCLEWTGDVQLGYGRFWSVRGVTTRAHRWIFILLRNDIKDLVIHHKCKNKACVRVSHLEPMSSKEHARLSDSPKREQTHCLNGHKLAGSNLYIYFDKQNRPHRRCKKCHTMRTMKNQLRK